MENDNDNILEMLSEMYKKAVSQPDEKYKVNEIQMEKFNRAYQFFTENGGTIEPVRFTPQTLHAGMTVNFEIFDIYGSSVEEFKEIMGYVSAFGIDSLIDGRISISLTIPNVFEEK